MNEITIYGVITFNILPDEGIYPALLRWYQGLDEETEYEDSYVCMAVRGEKRSYFILNLEDGQPDIIEVPTALMPAVINLF